MAAVPTPSAPRPAPRDDARGPSPGALRVCGGLHVLLGLQLVVPAALRLHERGQGTLPEYSSLAPGGAAHGLLGAWEELGDGVMPWITLAVGLLLCAVGVGALLGRRWALAAGVRVALLAVVAAVTRIVIVVVPQGDLDWAVILSSLTAALAAYAVVLLLQPRNARAAQKRRSMTPPPGPTRTHP